MERERPEEEGKGASEEKRGERPASGFREDEGEDDTFWDKVRKGVVEGYQIAAEKTDIYARIASRRLNIVGITRKIERYRAEIGERVCAMLAENTEADIAGDSYVKDLVGRIRAAEEELCRKEAEIEEIRRESRGPSAKRPEEKA